MSCFSFFQLIVLLVFIWTCNICLVCLCCFLCFSHLRVADSAYVQTPDKSDLSAQDQIRFFFHQHICMGCCRPVCYVTLTHLRLSGFNIVIVCRTKNDTKDIRYQIWGARASWPSCLHRNLIWITFQTSKCGLDPICNNHISWDALSCPDLLRSVWTESGYGKKMDLGWQSEWSLNALPQICSEFVFIFCLLSHLLKHF